MSPQCEGLFHRVISQSGPLIDNSAPMQVLVMMMMMIAQSIDNSANTGMVTENSLDNGLDRGNLFAFY